MKYTVITTVEQEVEATSLEMARVEAEFNLPPTSRRVLLEISTTE